MSRADRLQALPVVAPDEGSVTRFAPFVSVSPEDRDALLAVVRAAQDLYERIEMDESVGVCLTDRVPSLRLGAALAAFEEGG